MKFDDVKDEFEWLEQECQNQKKLVDALEDLCHGSCVCYRFGVELISAQKKLRAYVKHKIGVEKYMKKLRYQGE